MYAVHHQELFRANRVYLQLEVLKLIHGEINLRDVTIQNGSIALLKMKDGYKNFDLAKKDTSQKKESKQSSLDATINRLILQNVKFSFIDSSKDKWFAIQFNNLSQDLNISPDSVAASVKGRVHFEGLAFKPEKGSYLTNKDLVVNLQVKYDIASKILKIFPSEVVMDKNNLKLRGNFSFNEKPHMHLEIFAPQITVDEVNTVLTKSIAEKLVNYRLDNPVSGVVYLDGDLLPGLTPRVDVFFKTQHNSIVMKTKTFSDLEMLGWFKNHEDEHQPTSDSNSRVIIPHFIANI